MTIDAAHTASVYGGFSCAGWAYTGERAKLTGDVAGVALTVRNVTQAVRLYDIEVEVLAGTDAIPSSIAVFVSRSTDVTFRRAKLVARDGKDGASGVAAPGGVATPSDLTGVGGSGNNGGAEKTCTCSTGSFSTGGKGGDGGGGVSDGQAGKIVMGSSSPAAAPGAGQLIADCAGGTNSARPGSNAPQGVNGTAASTVGLLDAEGWRPASGGRGIDAAPGQGGGGGAGQPGGGGGGGACGGCGGGGGGGGQAGGSSIALATFESTVHVTDSQLVAASAKKGGAGVGGAAGQDGGAGGNRAGTACNGANGGKGGAGGAGAGGAGGISAGVLSNAGAVDLDAASQAAIQIGTLGAAGTGGAPPTNDGKAGKAAPTLTTTQL